MGFDHPTHFLHPYRKLLLTFLSYSKPLRDFCGFSKIPDTSKIPRFKQDFLNNLLLVFDNLVDVTGPICQIINSAKADMTIFDSSSIEGFVTENNPKYINRIIRQLKAYAKAQGFDKSYNLYKVPCPSILLLIWRSSSFISMGILLCLQVWHYHQWARHHPAYLFL